MIRKSLLIACVLGYCITTQAQITPPETDHETSDLTEVAEDQTAFYPGGLRAFRTYIANNYNFHNVDMNDLSEDEKKNSDYLLYLSFTVNEEGIPVDFSSKNTSVNNSFYKEAVRVIGSTRWTPAQVNGMKKKQYINIPLLVYLENMK